MKIRIEVLDLPGNAVAVLGSDGERVTVARVRAITAKQLDATMQAMDLLSAAFGPVKTETVDDLTGHGRC